MATDTQKISWLTSIQTKIALLIIFIVTLALSAATGYEIIQFKQQRSAELVELADATADRLASHLQKPLWDRDDEQISETMTAEMREQRLFGIIVRDSDGLSVFAASKRNHRWQPAPFRGQQFGARGLITSERAVSKDEEKLGEVEVYLTRKFLDQQLRENIIARVAQLLVLDLLIFIAIFFTLRKIVIKPINRLADAADAMSKGDFDVSINLAGKNEIGQVALAMQRMKISLRMAMTKINSGAAV